jgi:hypothetical protein
MRSMVEGANDGRDDRGRPPLPDGERTARLGDPKGSLVAAR